MWEAPVVIWSEEEALLAIWSDDHRFIEFQLFNSRKTWSYGIFLNHLTSESVQENPFRIKTSKQKTTNNTRRKSKKKFKKWLVIFDSTEVAFLKGFNGVNCFLLKLVKFWFVTRYLNNAFQLSCIRITFFINLFQ